MTTQPRLAVRASGLVKQFGDHRAVDGIDLEVLPGEMFGLLGPNGAGKTTTIRILTTLLRVPQGVASVLGHDVARERMTVRRLIGYVPQQLSAEGALTGRAKSIAFSRPVRADSAESCWGT